MADGDKHAHQVDILGAVVFDVSDADACDPGVVTQNLVQYVVEFQGDIAFRRLLA